MTSKLNNVFGPRKRLNWFAGTLLSHCLNEFAITCEKLKASIHIIIFKQNSRSQNIGHSKQEAHGPYCSHEKQFRSINIFAQSYDYTIKLIQRENITIKQYL